MPANPAWNKKPTQIAAAIAIAIALVVAVASVIQSHASQAESFPRYSAFRTLPEGASILYQALRQTPGMTAERNIQPLGALHLHDSAILMLGIEPATLYQNDQWFADMTELVRPGNRLIVALLPHRNRFIQGENTHQTDALRPWGLRLDYFRETDMRDEEEDTLILGWPMYIAQPGDWRTLRKEAGRPVVVEHSYGKGSIVLLTNSFPLTNAAMVDDRQTDFLADLIGPVHQAIFDETHLGIEETGSIAALARRYRLQGLALALVLTASLFIWKSAAGFPPPWGGVQPAPSVTGEDSSAAFLNLLRRNIKPDDILPTCVDAWGKIYQRQAGADLATAADLARAGCKRPARTYAEIQQLLGARHNPS